MRPLSPSDAGPAPRRILVVDDHCKLWEPLAVLLRRAGFDVRVAEGAAAMALVLRHTPVDLVVLDAMLPDGDGFDLCLQLRDAGSPPVILLTARAETHDRIVGLEQGADDYLVKPFEPKALVARIRRVLRRTGAVPQPTPAAPAPRHAPCLRPLDAGRWTLDAGRAPCGDHACRGPRGRAQRHRAAAAGPAAAPRAGGDQPATPEDRGRPALLRTAWGDGYLLTVACVPLSP